MKRTDIENNWLKHRENCDCKLWYRCDICYSFFTDWVIALLLEKEAIKPIENNKFLYFERNEVSRDEILEAMTFQEDVNFLVIYDGDAFWCNTRHPGLENNTEILARREFQKQIFSGYAHKCPNCDSDNYSDKGYSEQAITCENCGKQYGGGLD